MRSGSIVLTLITASLLVAPAAVATHVAGVNYKMWSLNRDVPFPLAAGDVLTVHAEGHVSNLSPTGATVAFLVDGVEFGRAASTYHPIWADDFRASHDWTATAGWHNLQAMVDPDNLIAETSETDNTESRSVFVYAGLADVNVTSITVQNIPLVADAGTAPVPSPDHEVRVEYCNDAAFPVLYGTLSVKASASTPVPALSVTKTIGEVSITGLAAGACRELDLVWDGLGSFGEIEIRASATAIPERDLADNTATERVVLYVGGAGGFVRPWP